jgi:predicted NBD/HSP70 family sugar kinase
MKILAVDVGGTHVKILATDQMEVRRIVSGLLMTAARMVDGVRQAAEDWEYEAVSIGYPGPVVNGKPALEPRNLASGWMGYDFAGHFGRPVKIINDAAMQALGSYEGGRMLFLGLGTGLGSALVVDGNVAPMELAHLPYKKGLTFEDYVGARGLARRGKKKWRKAVEDVSDRLRAALVADYVVLGGGNAKKLKRLPSGARPGSNQNAFVGGFRLWHEYANVQPALCLPPKAPAEPRADGVPSLPK